MPEPLDYETPGGQDTTPRRPMTNKWALDFALWLAKVLIVLAAIFGSVMFAMLASF